MSSNFDIREVHRSLAEAGEASRRQTVSTFAAIGGSFDRWQRQDKIAMAAALTATEDAIEIDLNGRMTSARLALRTLRRRIESEVST